MAGTKTAIADSSRGRDAVDAVLDELDRLATGDSGAEQFYAALFARLGSLGCRATAIWGLAGGEVRLERHSPGTDGELASPAQMSAIQEAIAAGRPKLLATGGAKGRSLVAPWKIAEAPEGALQVWPEGDAPSSADEGYLRLLGAIAEIVAAFRTRQEQQRLRQQLDQQGRIGPFTESLHASLEPADVAYKIANDGRVLLGCDRMAVAVRRGRRYKVQAVSGAEHVHRRSESVRQLERLCERVVATGEPLWHDGSASKLLPQVSEALDDYLELSPAIALAVVPLSSPAAEQAANVPPVGALICEQYAEPFSPATRAAIGAIAGHCRLALVNARRVDSIPAHRLWLALGREGTLSKWAFRSLAAAAVLALAVGIFLAVPADVQVKARGELQPVVRHEVFAPRDGVVTAIHVDHGGQVQAAEKLLEIRSPELDLELQSVHGELETKRKQLAAAQSERLQFKPGDPELRLKQAPAHGRRRAVPGRSPRAGAAAGDAEAAERRIDGEQPRSRRGHHLERPATAGDASAPPGRCPADHC